MGSGRPSAGAKAKRSVGRDSPSVGGSRGRRSRPRATSCTARQSTTGARRNGASWMRTDRAKRRVTDERVRRDGWGMTVRGVQIDEPRPRVGGAHTRVGAETEPPPPPHETTLSPTTSRSHPAQSGGPSRVSTPLRWRAPREAASFLARSIFLHRKKDASPSPRSRPVGDARSRSDVETATPDPAPETPMRRRRGRPRSRPEEVRAVRLQVLVTEAEAADVRAVAAATGLSVSDFGRRRMLGKQTALLAEKVDRDATRSEINRVGVNLNQLLRRVHSGATSDGGRRLESESRRRPRRRDPRRAPGGPRGPRPGPRDRARVGRFPLGIRAVRDVVSVSTSAAVSGCLDRAPEARP